MSKDNLDAFIFLRPFLTFPFMFLDERRKLKVPRVG